jgi:hypothetical protein
MTRASHTTDHRRLAPASRWPRRLAAVAFAVALATIAFAVTVASLASLAVPAPAASTVTFVPAPPSAPASSGGGR